MINDGIYEQIVNEKLQKELDNPKCKNIRCKAVSYQITTGR